MIEMRPERQLKMRPIEIPIEKLLNTDEIAAILNVSTNTVSTWCRMRWLPAFKLGPDARQWKVYGSALKQFLEAQEQDFLERERAKEIERLRTKAEAKGA